MQGQVGSKAVWDRRKWGSEYQDTYRQRYLLAARLWMVDEGSSTPCIAPQGHEADTISDSLLGHTP